MHDSGSTHNSGTVELVAEGPHEDGDNDCHEVVHKTIVRLHPQELQGKNKTNDKGVSTHF